MSSEAGVNTSLDREAVTDAMAQAKPPFLRRVQIRGYKSIDFCDVTLEPLTILVGRNASGKSNFLDALAFVRDILAKGLAEAVTLHRGRNAILSHTHSDNFISFSIDSNFANPISHATFSSQYEITVDLPKKSKPVITRETLRISNRADDNSLGYRRTGEHIEWIGFQDGNMLMNWCPPDRLLLGIYGNSPFLELSVALHELTICNFSPELIRELQTPTPGYLLDKTGKNLASVISNLRSQDPKTLGRIQSYLTAIIQDVECFDVVPYGEYETVKFRFRANGETHSSEFDAFSMSDGTLRVLASLVAAFQIPVSFGPILVGIEEPETALHPAAMRALVAALDEATLRTQIILTTHSPELLDSPEVKPANVRVVKMIDGKTVIAPVDEASVSIVRDHLSTLGGLERERQLEPDFDDLQRQAKLARQGRGHG